MKPSLFLPSGFLPAHSTFFSYQIGQMTQQFTEMTQLAPVHAVDSVSTQDHRALLTGHTCRIVLRALTIQKPQEMVLT